MGKFGDGVAHRFISNTFRTITTVNVRNTNATNARRARRSKRFNAIAQHHNNIRRQQCNDGCEVCHATTKRRSIRKTPRLTFALHREFLHGRAETANFMNRGYWRKKVCAARDDDEFKFGVRVDSAADASQQSPLSARACHYCDSSHATSSATSTRSKCTSRKSVRPTNSATRLAQIPVPGRLKQKSASLNT